METIRRKLRVDWENEEGLCGLKKKQAVKEKELCVAPRCYECSYAQEF
jgi:hypothetical protein